MTSRVVVPNRTSAMTRLLAIALVIVTILPIVIFATDLTNRRVLQAARERALQRASVRPRPEPQDVRRERIRARRASIHPTVSSMAMSMAFQLVMLTVIAVIGKRLFALRL